jgi:O-acetyl-ADP-ribose deacetylase (regulator of RNase III)
MKLQLVQGNILEFEGDAIVNPANSKLHKGGGLCGAIFKAAGDNAKHLAKECQRFAPVSIGNAVCTNAYNLPCKYIIHAVGPKWIDGLHGEKVLLKSAYERALEVAHYVYEFKSVAFPLISSGIFGYPKLHALDAAVSAFHERNGYKIDVFLYINDEDVLRKCRNEYPTLFDGEDILLKRDWKPPHIPI